MLKGLRPPARHDTWTRLGLLGTLLTTTVLFVQLPIVILTGSITEFHSSAWHVLGLGLVAVLAAVLVAALLLRMVGLAARRVLASASCALGLAAWVRGNFFVGSMTLLNAGSPVDFDARHPVLGLIVAGTLTTLVAFVVARAPRPSSLVVTVVSLGLCASTAAAILQAPRRSLQRYSGAAEDLFRLSTRENVLVVLLDGLEWRIARDALQRSPDIALALDGFQAYPDTAGAARTTFLSLPAIHSGAVYAPPAPMGQYFVKAITDQSFMNRFATIGFETALLNPLEGVCPSQVQACVAAAQLLYSSTARVKHEGLHLLDLSLFRASPAWLRRRIFNKGLWFAARLDVPWEIARVIEGNDLLNLASRKLSVDDGAPTLKFIHSLSTHTPYVLNDDCRTYTKGTHEPQMRCALQAVASLLGRLKEVGAYDNTVIAVIADHGVDPGVYGRRAGDDGSRNWKSLAGSANPTFLMKPRGSRGPLRLVSDSIYLPDVGALLCAESPRCRAHLPIAAPATVPRRPRLFNDYEWRHDFWQLQTVGRLVSYEIRGPVWEQSSWLRLNHPQ